VKGEPVEVRLGLENLNSAGKVVGKEKLEVRIVLLKNKRRVAEDSVVVDFTALRTIAPTESRSRDNRMVRWFATYHPSPQDRYQILAFGDRSVDATLRARTIFYAAKVVTSGPQALPLVGVVRPPLDSNPSWGIAVGQLLPNGQIKFSFSRESAQALCKAMMSNPAQARLSRGGFGSAAGFGVREIADEKEDGRPKQRVSCDRFS